MIFRQLFHRETWSYAYLVARRAGGQALLVDPLGAEVDTYVALLAQLELELALAVATHSHQGETGLGVVRERTGCETLMGPGSEVPGLSRRATDGEWLELDRMLIQALHTPGHTADSTCFAMNDRAFTGDTLLIRSTGRTDLDGGDARAQYDSLFGTVLWLADHTLVYPAHDYKGWTVSSIAEERAFNPRLQQASAEEYVAVMAELAISSADFMDEVPTPWPSYGTARRRGD